MVYCKLMVYTHAVRMRDHCSSASVYSNSNNVRTRLRDIYYFHCLEKKRIRIGSAVTLIWMHVHVLLLLYHQSQSYILEYSSSQRRVIYTGVEYMNDAGKEKVKN